MVFQVAQFWDILSDGFQIILCLLILGFLIKNRAIHKKFVINKMIKGAEHSFNRHVFNTTVQQLVNHAFTNITDTIAAERTGLERLLGQNPLGSEDDDISKAQYDYQLKNTLDNHLRSDDHNDLAGCHEKVKRCSAKGLNARKISEKLKIPLGEVELILSLQKK